MQRKLKNTVKVITGGLFCLVLFVTLSCTDEREKYGEAPELIDFSIARTRATDTTFEDGDKIGIYAVELGQSFQPSGNHADNKQYTYQSGKFQPVSPGDEIYGVKGRSYVYHAYYPYQSGIDPSSVVFDATTTTTTNRPLWSVSNSGSSSSVQLVFSNIFSLFEVNINKTADNITSGNMLNKYPKVTMNMCSNTLTTLKQNATSVPLTLYDSSDSGVTFRAFLPGDNKIVAGDELFAFRTASSESKMFYATKDMTTVAGERNVFSLTHNAITYGNWNISVSASPATLSAAGGTSLITATATRDIFTNGTKTGTDTANPGLSVSGAGFTLSEKTLTVSENTGSVRSCIITAAYGGVSKTCTVTQSAGVTTYEYKFTVSPTFLSFSSKGETKRFTVTSTRTKVINGTNTGVSENVGYTSAVGGADAGGFSISGTTVIASANPTTGLRDATVTITQTGSGKTAVITLEQDEKVNVDTEIGK